MPREIGYKAQHGYTTSADFDEGMCYRQISEEMTRRGMKMNVSGARHILVDALDKIAREVCNDESFIMQYLTEEKARELNLFTFSPKSGKNPDWTIDDIVDGEESWKDIRASLLQGVAGNMIPTIYVSEVKKDNTLILQHEHDGRDLELDYADNCVRLMENLWNGKVKLYTIIEEESFEIS